jgi:hypothetical protein
LSLKGGRQPRLLPISTHSLAAWKWLSILPGRDHFADRSIPKGGENYHARFFLNTVLRGNFRYCRTHLFSTLSRRLHPDVLNHQPQEFFFGRYIGFHNCGNIVFPPPRNRSVPDNYKHSYVEKHVSPSSPRSLSLPVITKERIWSYGK